MGNIPQTRASSLFAVFAIFHSGGVRLPHIYKKHTHALVKR